MKFSSLLLICLLLAFVYVAYSATTEQVTQTLEEFVKAEAAEAESEPEIMNANQQSMVETLAVTESDEPIVEESGYDLEETL